jgi:hypothetical protein
MEFIKTAVTDAINSSSEIKKFKTELRDLYKHRNNPKI